MMIIDDDLMSREVLALLAVDAGFEADAYESGEAALQAFNASDSTIPDVVLADMQMPGISGNSLARLLRQACGTATRLFAISGSLAPADRTSAFDGFLLKPFSMDDVLAALDHSTSETPAPPAEISSVLNHKIFDAFAQSMSVEQLRKLYILSLDDADARIEVMRQALAANDTDAYCRAAHSIKGGCGLVGAAELADLASTMEESGPQAIDDVGPLEQFLSASARLRRILDALYK
jgi:CheY-like chemotaxis protein/HPt (histidine-containing phosphotransfer) domain-containing protein